MIDVGAHLGGALSLFAHSGWRVYAIEPDSENRKKLETTFGSLQNVVIDSRAMSDQTGVQAILYRSTESTGISGLSSFHPSHRPGEVVNVTTLGHFFDEQGITNQSVDFLKIDTEGFDLRVLKGIPWHKISPRLILCEFEDSKTIPLGYTFHDLAKFLVAHGYKLIVSEWYPIERYGVSHKWRQFATYPCKLMDTGAWGNILATNDDSLYDALLQICNINL
jgi:FkbM family methyltransferase